MPVTSTAQTRLLLRSCVPRVLRCEGPPWTAVSRRYIGTPASQLKERHRARPSRGPHHQLARPISPSSAHSDPHAVSSPSSLSRPASAHINGASPSPSSSGGPPLSSGREEHRRRLLAQAENTVGQASMRSLYDLLLGRYGRTLTPAEYSRLITLSYQRTRTPHPLTLTVYHSFIAHHSLDTADLSLLQHALPVLSRHRLYRQCLAVWQTIHRRDLPVDASTLGVVLHACDQENDELAWRIFRKYKDSPASAIAPSPHPSVDDEEGAEDNSTRSPVHFPHDALSQVQSSSSTSPFNLLHYTHIISALNRTTFAHHVPLILSHMRQHRIRPDLFLYTRILHVLGSQRLYREQLAVLREMSVYGVMADEKCYYLVVRCHGESGRWKEAMALIEEMKEKRVPINEFIYEAAIIACEKVGRVETAKEVTREMHQRGVVMTWASYASLVQQAKQAGEFEWVLHLYHAVKGRKRYREHTLTNDAVIYAAQKLSPHRRDGHFDSSPCTSLTLSPAEIARELEGHIGPLGYWTLIEEKVRDLQEHGAEALHPDVRDTLALALTPTSSGRLGVLVMTLHSTVRMEEGTKPLMYLRPPSHHRSFRITAPSQPVEHTIAAVELLLQAVYWKAAMDIRSLDGKTPLSEDEQAWMQRMVDVPTCFDTLEVRCHTDAVIEEEEEREEEEVEDVFRSQPTIGQFCADSVNDLWTLITKPFTPSKPDPFQPNSDTELDPEQRAGPPTSAPLTPRPRPISEMRGKGVDLGRVLVDRVREHLSSTSGMKVEPPSADGYEHVLTIRPQHLRSWVQLQHEDRQRKRRDRARARNHADHTHSPPS